jgi:hypothetical protein
VGLFNFSIYAGEDKTSKSDASYRVRYLVVLLESSRERYLRARWNPGIDNRSGKCSFVHQSFSAGSSTSLLLTSPQTTNAALPGMNDRDSTVAIL